MGNMIMRTGHAFFFFYFLTYFFFCLPGGPFPCPHPFPRHPCVRTKRCMTPPRFSKSKTKTKTKRQKNKKKKTKHYPSICCFCCLFCYRPCSGLISSPAPPHPPTSPTGQILALGQIRSHKEPTRRRHLFSYSENALQTLLTDHSFKFKFKSIHTTVVLLHCGFVFQLVLFCFISLYSSLWNTLCIHSSIHSICILVSYWRHISLKIALDRELCGIVVWCG